MLMRKFRILQRHYGGGDCREPGAAIADAGTTVMGHGPAHSVLNSWNQIHDVQNVFATDGACMPSMDTDSPSLTLMALTARAASHAAELVHSAKL